MLAIHLSWLLFQLSIFQHKVASSAVRSHLPQSFNMDNKGAEHAAALGRTMGGPWGARYSYPFPATPAVPVPFISRAILLVQALNSEEHLTEAL